MKKTNPPKKGLLTLVIGKEGDEAISLILKSWTFPYQEIDAEDFSAETFMQEVEALSLFTSKKGVFIRGVDGLKKGDMAALLKYAAHPSAAVEVLLSATSLSASSELFKLVEKNGDIVVIPDLKPWEKEKELQSWVMGRAAQSNAKISLSVAASLISLIGSDRELLQRELEKLSCFVDEGGEIKQEAIAQLCHRMPQETFWQLSDAIFRNDRVKAISIANVLMEEENVFFALIGHLRTQYRQALQVCSVYPSGGESGVARAFPQWRGKMVQKKIDEALGKGEKTLAQGLISLFEYETRAKNGSGDLHLLLECLIFQLTKAFYAPSSFAKPIR